MKTRRICVRSIWVGVLIVAATASGQVPVGTAFTYQGYLESIDGAVTDTCDFEFTLWDDAVTPPGAQQGPIQSVNGVAVDGGLFTVWLDFGEGVFEGDARWLEVSVKCTDDPVYDTLSPRQELTPAPYAVYARSSAPGNSLDAADGSPTAAVFVDNDGRVGIGPTSPSAYLDVNPTVGTAGDEIFRAVSPAHFEYKTSDVALIRGGPAVEFSGTVLKIQSRQGDSSEYALLNVENNLVDTPSSKLYIRGDGNVGIGTTTPGSQLDVAGFARATRFQDRDDANFYLEPANGEVSAKLKGSVVVNRGNGPGSVFLETDQSVLGEEVGRLWFRGPGGPTGWEPYAGVSGQMIASDYWYEGALLLHSTGACGEPFAIPCLKEQMRIAPGGNVGIGTDNPQAKLHVAGDEGVDGIMFPDGSLQTTAAGGVGNAWLLSGNAGTTPGTDFLGTTDAAALEIQVDSTRALRIEPTYIPNLVGGFTGNSVTAGVYGATIGGGGDMGFTNHVTDDFGFVGGGRGNTAHFDSVVGGGLWNHAAGHLATVSGGSNNVARDGGAVGGGIMNEAGVDGTVGGGNDNIAGGGDVVGATVGGGSQNSASNYYSTVAGGFWNEALGFDAAVGGGTANRASGPAATVPGGNGNMADGECSFAAGCLATALHDGAFVWADATMFEFQSTASHEFSVRATGGARFVSAVDGSGNPVAGVELPPGDSAWYPLSDRNSKTNFEPLDPRDVLDRLAGTPITTWNYKAQDPSIRHVGPVAQDFHAAFGLGIDDKRISTIDADGVAMAAIQGLYEIVKERDAQIAAQEEQISTLQTRVQAIEAIVTRLGGANKEGLR